MAARVGAASALLAATKRSCRSYYDLLEVPPTAHLDDIKKAYRSKVLLLHPDKNKDAPEDAAELFNLVNVAYNTLSQVELRDKYDASLRAGGDERLMPLMLEGNEIWQAFEVMDKFRTEGFAVLSKVEELERRYQIPAGELRFREGVPCAGYESGCCHVRRLSADDCIGLVDANGTASATRPRRRATWASGDRCILLCHRHNYLHMCEGDQCGADEQVCPLYAMWLVERWMDARAKRWHAMFAQGHWRIEISRSDGGGSDGGNGGGGLPYWFNIKTGQSLWVDEWERDDVLRARDRYFRRPPPPVSTSSSSSSSSLSSSSSSALPEAEEAKREESTTSPPLPPPPQPSHHHHRHGSGGGVGGVGGGGGGEGPVGDADEEPADGRNDRHVCAYDVCHRHGFERLEHDVWVCHVGKAPHLCTRLQCHLTRREQNGAVVCWASRQLFAAGTGLEFVAGDHEAAVLPDDKVARALGVTTKTLAYVNEITGEVVTTEIEVPRGLHLDFSGPSLLEYGDGTALGKRPARPSDGGDDGDDDEARLRQRDIKRIKRLELDINDERRRMEELMRLSEREDVAPPDDPPLDDLQDVDEDDPDHGASGARRVSSGIQDRMGGPPAPKRKEGPDLESKPENQEHEEAEEEGGEFKRRENDSAEETTAMTKPSTARSRLHQMMLQKQQQQKQQQLRGNNKRGRKGKEKEEEEEEEEEEDIFAHASDTIYSIYGGSLDLVGHRRTEEWETIQGFAGGFEGVQEEEEEERDVEMEAQEMKARRQQRLEYKARQHVGLIEPKREKQKPDQRPDAASARPLTRRR